MPPVVVAAAIVGGTTLYAQREQQKQASKQRKAVAAAQEQQRQFETEAGEHWEELNVKQMEMQAQQHQITLLSDIIKSKETPEPIILTTPPAKTETPIAQINRAIGKLLTG